MQTYTLIKLNPSALKRGFFDNINHSKLISQLWKLGIREKRLLSIIKCLIKLSDGTIKHPNKGSLFTCKLLPLSYYCIYACLSKLSIYYQSWSFPCFITPSRNEHHVFSQGIYQAFSVSLDPLTWFHLISGTEEALSSSIISDSHSLICFNPKFRQPRQLW